MFSEYVLQLYYYFMLNTKSSTHQKIPFTRVIFNGSGWVGYSDLTGWVGRVEALFLPGYTHCGA
jgi:hypothetical protein